MSLPGELRGVACGDRILAAHGAVEAMGTHAELLAQDGRYAPQFEPQVEEYR